MEARRVLSSILLAVVSVSRGYAADITLSWGPVSVNDVPRVSLLATSNVDIFKIEFACGYTFEDGTVTIGVESLFPQLFDGEIATEFDLITSDVDSNTITAVSISGLPIPAGTFVLTKFAFPASTEGAPFCVLPSSKFFNADLSIEYEVEGPGCIVLAEPDVRMKFRNPSINPSTNLLEVAIEAEITREVYGVQMETQSPSGGVISSDSDINEFIDTIGSIDKFLMVSFSGDFVPVGVYDRLIVFNFPLESQGSNFCVMDELGTTLFSGDAGEALVHTGPGCVVLNPGPVSCPTAGTGDINGDETVNVLDIVAGRDIVLGKAEEDECTLATLDINLDAVGDILDLVSIIVDLIVG